MISCGANGIRSPIFYLDTACQAEYVYMLAIAIALELAGGILFIFNSTLGAFLLVSQRLQTELT